ncbi:MAG: hypothetical protein WCA21_06870 [Terracidiphilus sp.]|jgi:hypothetical protein
MKLSDLKQDSKNANKGTPRGRKVLASSLEQYGAGRSVLIDRDGNLIAGNKTAQQAANAGIEDVIVVQTDGTQLVAVQRTDLSMDDPKALGLAVADNRSSEVGLQWDADVLKELSVDLDLQPYFTEAELADLTGTALPDPDDAEDEWDGMPEADNEDVAKRHLTIHFLTEQDVQDFANLIQQSITDKTKYIWYPQQKPLVLKTTKYVINE